jgi:hypothetical protein
MVGSTQQQHVPRDNVGIIFLKVMGKRMHNKLGIMVRICEGLGGPRYIPPLAAQVIGEQEGRQLPLLVARKHELLDTGNFAPFSKGIVGY